jgi:hypothetical protein
MSEAQAKARKARFTALLLLERPIKLSFSQLRAELERFAPHALLENRAVPAIGPGTDPGVETLSLNGENLSVRLVDAPADPELLRPLPFGNLLWPNAEREAEHHKACLIIFGSRDPAGREAALARARAVTLLAAAFVRFVPAIGVLWADSLNLVRASDFAEMTKNIGQPDVNAVPFWVRFIVTEAWRDTVSRLPGPGAKKVGSLGLWIFGLMELGYPSERGFILREAYSVAENLLRSRKPAVVRKFDPVYWNGTIFTLDDAWSMSGDWMEHKRANQPIPASCFPPSLTFDRAEGKLPDMFHTNRSIIVFSEPARVAMEQRAPGEVEFIPVAVHAPRRVANRLQFASAYYFINVLGRAQRLQWLEMPTRRFPQEDGREFFGALPDLSQWRLRERAAGEPLIWHDTPWIIGNRRYSSHTNIFVEDVLWRELDANFPGQLNEMRVGS